LLYEQLLDRVDAPRDVRVEAGLQTRVVAGTKGTVGECRQSMVERRGAGIPSQGDWLPMESDAKRPFWLARALYDLGELQEKRGRFDEAKAAFVIDSRVTATVRRLPPLRDYSSWGGERQDWTMTESTFEFAGDGPTPSLTLMSGIDFPLLTRGGPIMWVLVALALIGVFLFHRGARCSCIVDRSPPRRPFCRGIKNALAKRRLVEALTLV
jgi:hypothetical protein